MRQTSESQTQTMPSESVTCCPSYPGDSGGPASADEASANTNTQVKSKRLIGSPLVVVGNGGGFAAKTLHTTTDDPSDLVLFRALIFAGRPEDAARLCRERLLQSRDALTSLRWTKDLAIVERVRRRPDRAFDLLASVHWIASTTEGAARGKYESGFGITCEQLGRHDEAFEHYTAGSFFAGQAGDLILAAQIDTNTGRCYTAAKEPESSHEYFDRALEVAIKSNDSHLQGEIHESIALALEAEGKYAEAEGEALLSVRLISATGDRTALEESARTWMRLKAKSVPSPTT
jgi:tetratricopeptide (TPR) repeat protein